MEMTFILFLLLVQLSWSAIHCTYIADIDGDGFVSEHAHRYIFEVEVYAFEENVGSDEDTVFVGFTCGGSVVVFVGIEHSAVVTDGVVGGRLFGLEVGGKVSNESEFAKCFDFCTLHSQ